MTAQTRISPAAWLQLLLLALLWGGSFLCNRITLTEVGVLTGVAMRVVGAAALLWLWVLAAGLALPRSPRRWLGFLVMGLLNNVVPFCLIVWGQQHVDSGLAAILNAATAIFGVLVAACIFPDERLSARKALGVAFGFAGVVVVIGAAVLRQLDPTSLGQLAILGAALSYALAGSFARKALRGPAPPVLAAGMLTGSSLVMVPLAFWIDGAPTLAYSPPVWAALAYLAVCATALAYLLFYRVLALAGAGNLSLVTLLVAPTAIGLGAFAFGEALPPRAFAGFGLIAVGLVVLDGRLAARTWRAKSALAEPPATR